MLISWQCRVGFAERKVAAVNVDDIFLFSLFCWAGGGGVMHLTGCEIEQVDRASAPKSRFYISPDRAIKSNIRPEFSLARLNVILASNREIGSEL